MLPGPDVLSNRDTEISIEREEVHRFAGLELCICGHFAEDAPLVHSLAWSLCVKFRVDVHDGSAPQTYNRHSVEHGVVSREFPALPNEEVSLD